ncbi:MAG: MerR family transcriptional regulator [Nitrospirae bacterium]|nr:MAG: MerR family transcriptional regulator [Nitrospirota bacterium]
MAGAERLFAPREVVGILGITHRQLSHWAKTGLVTPAARTPGGHARYTFQDLVALATVKRLLDGGVPLQRVRSSVARLRELLPAIRRPLVELTLVASDQVVLVIYEGAAFEAVSGQQWILEVAELARHVARYDHRLGRAPPRGGAEENPHRSAPAM